jgi:hypothetical protein
VKQDLREAGFDCPNTWHSPIPVGQLSESLLADNLLHKGPSTRVRIRVRFRVRFHAQFAGKPDRDPIILLSPITIIGKHISAKKIIKSNSGTPLAANRTPNRMPIRTPNRTCRRPLSNLWTQGVKHCQNNCLTLVNSPPRSRNNDRGP